MKTQKPTWWPENPYPEKMYPMTLDEAAALMPSDPVIRTKMAGALGRHFWDVASEDIYNRLLATWTAHTEAKKE